MPSHAITKASGLLVVFVAPTAVKAMGEVHDTAFRVLLPGNLGIALWAGPFLHPTRLLRHAFFRQDIGRPGSTVGPSQLTTQSTRRPRAKYSLVTTWSQTPYNGPSREATNRQPQGRKFLLMADQAAVAARASMGSL